MSVVRTKEKAGAPDITKTDPGRLENVRAICASLAKYVHAKTIYTSNNPNIKKFAKAFHSALTLFFEHEKALVLAIEQYQIKWHEQVVYDNNDKKTSIAFLFFKDGVGEITFDSAVTQAELDQLSELIKNETYSPSAHIDIVGRLWQLDFTNIQYRVFDESTDGTSGEGGKSGSDAQDRPLQAADHRHIEDAEYNNSDAAVRSNNSFSSLGACLSKIVEDERPSASPREKEEFLQNLLASLFELDAEKLDSWREQCVALNDRDKLLWLLDEMIEFTQVRNTPAVTRDIMDTIDRIVRFVVWEARVPALITLLDAKTRIEKNAAAISEFVFIPERIYRELTDKAFLVMLGRKASASRDEAAEVLQYFKLLGEVAVPGIRELLAKSKHESTHKDACDALLMIAGHDIMSIISEFDLEDSDQVKDAVYMLRKVSSDGVPPLIEKLAASPEPEIKGHVIEFLGHVGNDEATRLLCQLMEDDDSSVRIKAFTAAESVRHPAIVKKVTALCFQTDTTAKGMDELERMFRTVGVLAGEMVLEPIRHMIAKKKWLRLGKSADKQDKLLAITALRYIPGTESLEILETLTRDRDSLVRTKASYMIKQVRQTRNGNEEDREPIVVERT